VATQIGRIRENETMSSQPKLQSFAIDVDGDGIATVTWDMAGRSMNVIDLGVMDEMDALIDWASAEDGPRGLVITSGKDAFCAGADLTMLEGLLKVITWLRARTTRRPMPSCSPSRAG
jgi:3-hydroxyacyl-CoA dehydrogenase/enoyl-CoA hydratase/3-hydroxybutyryl-CoA epimerase